MQSIKLIRTLLLGTLFFPSMVWAQVNMGAAKYKLVVNKNTNGETKEIYNAYKRSIDETVKQAQNLQFELLFNQNTSVFSLVKNLPLDKNASAVKMAMIIFDGDKLYYTNLKEKYLIEKKSFLSKDFQVKTYFKDMNWELVEEKKQISGYDCYKAIGKRYAMSKYYETLETEVVAWYCPEIPVRTGPFEAVGLPGLVLQLDLKGRTVVLEDLDLGKEVQVENPIKGESISQIEFDSIYKKRVKENIPR
ncbi:GLPGLI family protein [Flagellimonas sp.]|uniref:GLPGLI family protein n=1 Tax=Flagellimonas sp. TaxID=2058762 RepID=UPI003BACE193